MDDGRAIVERVLRGDKAAFGCLIDRHRSLAYAFARRMLEAADAEDIVQEALLAAFLKLRKLRDADSFRSWLLGIVANLAKTRLRQHREGRFDDYIGGRLIADFSLVDAAPSPESIHEAKEMHRIIFDAIAALPDEQHQTVRLHYVEGLKLREIAVLTGSPLGTLKARLHHARERLRISLASQLEMARRPDTSGGISMIEAVVHDVVARSPKGEEAKWLAHGHDYKLGDLRVIFLKERDGDRILPIWVGAIEGDWIALVLEKLEVARPMSLDLAAEFLRIGEMKLEKVAVTALRENTFIATMSIVAAGETREVDARPSDAITLALQMDAPIFVAPELLEQPFVHKAGEEFKPVYNDLEGAGVKEMEWRSYCSLPRAEVPGLRARAQ